ncbi:hypothetical protein SSP531S_19280 [Streptomyces spongiicola]|uniref:DUF5709 domain-containing protein n=1 Tax=Streptomyces spongiicola TaxID=1690221 RepID=A0A2S1Z4J7_9ACTN|nr:hypothetical protein [Streptomyces spongiicola]AWK11275.1 hypothetical protein DDQ41_22820 [Streptomyces spongiicola]GBQ00512.1 hypothetical protein SSP531S_19280 [Streptomyces spongiicola]
MAADPTDPDTFTEDDQGAPNEREELKRLPEETPEADAAEQHAEVSPVDDEPLTRIDPAGANEADALEQARVVALDEEDYR